MCWKDLVLALTLLSGSVFFIDSLTNTRYKLNFNKSELLPINHLSSTMSLSSISISRVVSDWFRYVEMMKMVILSKFFYLFQHIPIFIGKSFFHQLDQMMSSFLWVNKPPCIRKASLQLPKRLGGLALSNFIQYYWASNINKLSHWLDSRAKACPTWAQIELWSSCFSLQSFLTAQTHKVSQNPMVLDSIKIWMQFQKHFSLNDHLTLAMVFKNNVFSPFLTDSTFRSLQDWGLLCQRPL